MDSVTTISFEVTLPIILDLCSGSGAWSKPYQDSGNYDVRRIDLPTDVRLCKFSEPIYGILAAPPCTVFSIAGAGWKRTEAEVREGLSVVDACLRIVYQTRPKFWALENPSGKLPQYLGKPTYKFDPWEFGDPWTKLTYLWGSFNFPKTCPVFPTERSKMHKRVRRPEQRSVTPPGFAQAFYEANK